MLELHLKAAKRRLLIRDKCQISQAFRGRRKVEAQDLFHSTLERGVKGLMDTLTAKLIHIVRMLKAIPLSNSHCSARMTASKHLVARRNIRILNLQFLECCGRLQS